MPHAWGRGRRSGTFKSRATGGAAGKLQFLHALEVEKWEALVTHAPLFSPGKFDKCSRRVYRQHSRRARLRGSRCGARGSVCVCRPSVAIGLRVVRCHAPGGRRVCAVRSGPTGGVEEFHARFLPLRDVLTRTD